MIDAGMRIGIAEDVYIHHFGSATFGLKGEKWIMESLVRNKKILEEKWPRKERERLIKLAIGNDGNNGSN
jgi:hypothetical protein